MMQEYEAALAAQRERVFDAAGDYDCGEGNASWIIETLGVEAAIDDLIRLARAIGAAEILQAASATAENRMAWDHAHEALAAIIRELEGVESQA